MSLKKLNEEPFSDSRTQCKMLLGKNKLYINIQAGFELILYSSGAELLFLFFNSQVGVKAVNKCSKESQFQ